MGARIVRILAYTALFFVVFAIGVFVFFPMKLVTRIAEAQIERQLNYAYDISIDRISVSPFRGVRLRSVSAISTAPMRPGEEARFATNIDEIRVRPALLGLLKRNVNIRSDIRIGDGRVQVRFRMPRNGERTLELTSENVQLANVTVLHQRIGRTLTGQFSGTIAMRWTEEWSPIDGEINLNVDNLTMGDGEIPVGTSALFLRNANFGPTALSAGLERGNLAIHQFLANGQDVGLDARGDINLRTPMRNSRVSVDLLVRLDPGYIERADLGLPLQQIDLLNQARTGEGYDLRLTGVLGNLSPQPAGGYVPRGTR